MRFAAMGFADAYLVRGDCMICWRLKTCEVFRHPQLRESACRGEDSDSAANESGAGVLDLVAFFC